MKSSKDSEKSIFKAAAAPRSESRVGTSEINDHRPTAAVQRKLADMANENVSQLQQNDTGLPAGLKSGIENISGLSMDDVRVHRNSDKPAQLSAHAYAQGTDIHLAPGQEKHLPHEAWHVVQQKQGRVRPTSMLNGTVAINDNPGLEGEADTMGARALWAKPGPATQLRKATTVPTVQRVENEELRKQTDAGMDELKRNTIKLLGILRQTGEDWAKAYATQGREKAVSMTEELLKGKLPDVKKDVQKRFLEEVWGRVTAKQKLEMAGQAAELLGKSISTVFGKAMESGGSRSVEAERESRPQKKKEQEDSSGWGLSSIFSGGSSKKEKEPSDSSWIGKLTEEDLKKIYWLYKKKKEAENLVSEAKEKISSKAGDAGERLGSGVGEIRNEADFMRHVGKHRAEFKGLRESFASLEKSISGNKDSDRYQDEFDALSDALLNINGPAMVYIIGDLTAKGRANYVEICHVAQENLKGSGTGRETKSILSKAAEYVADKFRKLVGIEDTDLPELQGQVSQKIKGMLNADWSKVTSWKSTPSGVKELQKAYARELGSEDLTDAARMAAGHADRESSRRNPATEAFYQALKELKPENKNSLRLALSRLRDVEEKIK